MRLREYLDQRKEKPYQFAKRAKVRPATIYSLYNDGLLLNLTMATMQKIIMASGGKVGLEDLV